MGHAPVFLYTLGLLLFGWPLQSFHHVLNVIREPLLGPLHSYDLYHILANMSAVTLACILLRFVMLLVGNTRSPRVSETMQATFVMENGKNGSVGFIWDIG
jgi:hypothetical protein